MTAPSATAKKTDAALKTDVLAELNYEPRVKATDIGVLVKDGTVTLNGYATTFGEKWDAVRATKRVAGVIAIADDIEVKLPGSPLRNDGDIAAAAAHQIESSTFVPPGAVRPTVSKGWITIEGEVEWWYQKQAAANAVRYLAGVTGVENLISIKPRAAHENVGKAISTAFERSAQLDAKKINLEISGNKVVLKGKVRNYAERDEAEQAAWSAAGVLSVENHLTVVGSWDLADFED